MMLCPKCESSIEESSILCRYCRSRIGDPKPAAVSAAPAGAPGKETFEVIDVPAQPTGRPWEVWVVIVIVATNVVGSLTQGRMMALVIGALIISGLFKQSNLAWLFVTVINCLAALVCFFLIPERGIGPVVNGVSCLIVVGLMISCRVRGAYGTSMD